MDSARPQRSSRRPSTETTVEPLDISFGVEFEFIPIEKIPNWKEWETKKLEEKVFHGLLLVGDVPKKTRFQCNDISCNEQFLMPIGVQPTSAAWKPDHSQWNVVADDSMKLSCGQRTALLENHYDMFGVEVTSSQVRTRAKRRAGPRDLHARRQKPSAQAPGLARDDPHA
jgi:hypothetical protein